VVKVKTAKKGDPFTAEQLRAIFAKAVATKWGGKRSGSALWLLKVLIWSGARIGEISQLRQRDVVTIKGVQCIMLREGKGQSLKTDASERTIPLHPALYDANYQKEHGQPVDDFRKFAQSPKRDPAGKPTDFIFGCFHAGGKNKRATWAMNAFPKLMHGCGILSKDEDGKRLSQKSIRARFSVAMVEARLHPDVQRKITGHAGDDVHEIVYQRGQLDVRRLAEDIAEVDPLAD
jgi:integrase